MKFTFAHNNYNVLDLDRSIGFYEEALGLRETRRVRAPDGSFIIAFLRDGATDFELELTWLRDRSAPYDLGEGEYHLAFLTEDMEEARRKHGEMGCICFENHEMGVYFISDPDGYWLEILPKMG